MAIKKLIRESAKKNKKKISLEAIKKINDILEERLNIIITKSSRNADFSGRIVINERDIEE
jgi:histone H3/H4